jgi:thiopeptide-type bacteriocin biosynthesis protein
MLLGDLRERFIVAGAECLEREHNNRRWLQIGVSFEDDDLREQFLHGALRRLAHRWTISGRVRFFFFMAKPPGLRLRFCGLRPERDIAPPLERLLAREVARGRIRAYEYGVYDSESYQFGGEKGIDIAHDYFTYDSLAFLDLLQCPVERGSFPLLSLTVLNNLLEHLCEDDWERWDAWSKMALARRAPSLDTSNRDRAIASLKDNHDALVASIWNSERILMALDEQTQNVIRGYFEQNARLAERLRRAARTNRLLYGFRDIFPFYVIFHWNRWLLDQEMQLSLTFFMDALLNPKRPKA